MANDDMQAEIPVRAAGQQEIYLADIVAALGRRRRMIAAFVLAFTLLGLAYAIFSTPLYTASVTVQPATEEAGGLAGLRGQFGGVAALAGIDIAGGGSTKDEYLAILRSRELAERFIERYGIMRHLFPEKWDQAAETWKQSEPGLVSRLASSVSWTLAWLSGDQGWREQRSPAPTMWEAYKLFDEDVRSINEDVQTGIVTLSMEFRDPEIAARWANAYIALANAEIRDNAVEESTRALAYLNNEVQKTTVSGIRDTIFSLVETQLKKIMLADSRSEYAFKVLDRAAVPEQRSHPKRALIVVLSLLLGGMVGLFAALVKESLRGAFVKPQDTDAPGGVVGHG